MADKNPLTVRNLFVYLLYKYEVGKPLCYPYNSGKFITVSLGVNEKVMKSWHIAASWL